MENPLQHSNPDVRVLPIWVFLPRGRSQLLSAIRAE
jgi:hypothetical protein